jgi:hypothetical protein
MNSLALRRLAGLLASIVALVVAAPAHAASFWWCVNIDVDYSDTDIGEDLLLDSQGHPLARGLTVRVSRQDNTKSWAVAQLDALGCYNFTDTTNGPFRLEVESSAKIYRTDNASFTNTIEIRNSAGNLAEWTFIKTFPAGGGNHTSTLPQTRRTNLLAATINSVYRFSDGLSNKTITVHDLQCPSYATPTSCAGGNGGGAANVWIQPGHDEKKFLIAHEIGHAVQWLWFNFNQPGNYTINDGGAACEWANPENLAIRLHALHTKERSSIAFTEGFAQYYATYSYNLPTTVGWFHYYKDDYKNPPGVTTVNMENGPEGGATAYLDNECTNDINGKAGMGVELDWARQLWDYRTQAGDQPTHYQLMRQMKNGFESGAWTQSNTWSRSEAGVAEYDGTNGTNFADRWHDLGVANGIDH